MPKNKGKGGKNRRRGKNENDCIKRELILKEPGQEYAQVARMLGNGRLEAMCMDGQKRSCHIRGKLRKKVWINNGDLILLGLRDYQDEKADVILKYLPEEARQLKNMGAIPAHVNITDVSGFGADRQGTGVDGEVIFDDDAQGAVSSQSEDENAFSIDSDEEDEEDEEDDDSDTGMAPSAARKVKFDASANKKKNNKQPQPQLPPNRLMLPPVDSDEEEEDSENDVAEELKTSQYSRDRRRVYQASEDLYDGI